MASAAQQEQAAIALTAYGGVCDLSKRTYFETTVGGNMNFTFVNAPADVRAFEVEVLLNAGSITWPANVRWAEDGVTPSGLKVGKIHKFFFSRPQTLPGVDQWLGSYNRNH